MPPTRRCAIASPASSGARARPRRAIACDRRLRATRARRSSCRRCRDRRRCRTRTPSRFRSVSSHFMRQSPGASSGICSRSIHRRRARIAGCVRSKPAKRERAHGPRRIPHRRHAGQKTPALGASSIDEALHAVDAFAHHRMIEAVAHQVERDQRVHPRRLNPAPAAVGFLPFDDPLATRRCALLAPRLSRTALVEFLQPLDRHQPAAAAHASSVRAPCRARRSRRRRRRAREPASSRRRSSAARRCRAPSRRSRRD